MQDDPNQATPRIGIDFGGVIVRKGKGTLLRTEDTSLTESAGGETAHEGVFEAIHEIGTRSAGHVWIISKAGPRMQERTRRWLETVDFFERTGLDPTHLRFCLERPEKEPICRELRITHYIDDHVHVMQILRQTVPHLFLFGDESREQFCPPWATFVSEWSTLPDLIVPRSNRLD